MNERLRNRFETTRVSLNVIMSDAGESMTTASVANLCSSARPQFGKGKHWAINALSVKEHDAAGRAALVNVLKDFKAKGGGCLIVAIADAMVRFFFAVAARQAGISSFKEVNTREALQRAIHETCA